MAAGGYARVLVRIFLEWVKRGFAQYGNAALRAVPVGVGGQADNFETVQTGFARGSITERDF